MIRSLKRLAFLGATLVAAACASTPHSESKREELRSEAAHAREEMIRKDPGVRALLDQSAGYFVFPAVKEGGFIVGGAGATGVIYEHGQDTGFAELSRASFGAQIGGQKYAELVIVRDKFTLDKMKAGDMELGGSASAVVLKAGAATSSNFSEKGVAIVVDPLGGAMVSASVSGQKIKATF